MFWFESELMIVSMVSNSTRNCSTGTMLSAGTASVTTLAVFTAAAFLAAMGVSSFCCDWFAFSRVRQYSLLSERCTSLASVRSDRQHSVHYQTLQQIDGTP